MSAHSERATPDAFLERIVAATREALAERRAAVPLEALRTQAAAAPPPRDFAGALRPRAAGPARLIAEVKRASPSKGLLAATFDPVAQARAYAAGGAAAISVLTEPRYFLGSLDHLRAVRAAAEVPVLRKEFVLDAYQVYEARAAGADALLLICALLDDVALRELLALTRALGMEALVEAHSAAEARRAVAADARVIGVNARDLRTFAVDGAVVQRLRPLVPRDRVFVAESGISDVLGAARARAWGADAILVGEALMRATDAAALTRALADAPGGRAHELFSGLGAPPFIKHCGLTTPEQAEMAVALGVDAIGLVFYPPSHRNVSVGRARPIASLAAGAGVRAVGVFVNAPLESIVETQRAAALSAIQLSGDETPLECALLASRVSWPILKALRPRTEADLALLDAYALADAVVLLDTPRAGSYGGTGATGDWELIGQAAARWPIILSGGLTPENVAAALAATGARGVDVSSGIETNREKDPAKMRAFVRASRDAGRAGSPRDR